MRGKIEQERRTEITPRDSPADHPLRPTGHRPLDDFWRSQGYTKRPELQAIFEWKEIGEEIEFPKTLTFWTKVWG